MAHTLEVADAALLPDDLLVTKLYLPPPRQSLVSRPRLTERLSTGLQGPLTLLVAPAGWGKTTLLGDWRAGQGERRLEGQPRGRSSRGTRPMGWLALDEGDNDLARFLRYLIAALQTVEPDVGRSALARLRSPQPPPAEALLTLLLNDLTALPEDVTLVLDDYHAIETPAIHGAVAFLLERLPPGLHLLIASRADPPLPLARLRARGQLMELRAADLAFSGEEAADFLNRTMGLDLSAEDVAALESRTEGWIAGLHLAALSLRDRDPARRHEFITALSGTHRYILDYLAGEVFDRQPPEVRRFLLYTSVLGGLSGALCDAVLAGSDGDGPLPDGQTTLERLDEANLFVVRLDDHRAWYRYHHLFAGFLRERLRRERPDLIPELHRRAARWLEENGRPAYAAEHALSAEDYDEAARLIERAIRPIIWQRGELMTLQRWLGRLPRAATRKRPRLSLDLAWALLWSAQIDAVEPRLQDAEQALGDQLEGSRRATRGEVAAIRAELTRQKGEIAAAIALARQALADLPQEERLVRGATSGLLGQAYLVSGDAAAASHAFAEAAALGQTPDTTALALIARGRLIQTLALRGQLHGAEASYRQALHAAESAGMAETPAIGVAQVYMAEVRCEWDELDAAEDLARRGIARCIQWPGLAEMGLDGYLTLARLLQARGDADGAHTVLEQAESLGRDAHVNQYEERVGIARVRLWIGASDGAAAMRWARAREDALQADENPGYVALLERLTLARLHLALGRPDDAAVPLNGLAEAAEVGDLIGCLIESLVLRALCLQGQGQTAQAMVALARALSLAEPRGYVRLFVDEGPRMAGLLREARTRGLAPAYVDALLAASGASMAIAGEAAPVEPLSARELELLRLLASGLSTAEIAAQLFITTGTARNHLKSIFGKLDVHSRVQAVERARALNLLT